MEMCPVVHQFHFSVFVEDVPSPTSVSLLIVWWRCALSYTSSLSIVWWRCALSYISFTSQSLMEMCPVLHQYHFSQCLMEMCPVLHQYHFSQCLMKVCSAYICYTSRCLMEMFPVLYQVHFALFDGDVPCPTSVKLLIDWWFQYNYPFSNR